MSDQTHFLKDIPSDWRSDRMGNVAEILFSNVDKHTFDSEIPVRLCNYVDVYKNDRITSDIEFMEASAEPREIAHFQIQKGDVLATKDSETPDDIAIPSLVAETLPGVLCSYHLALIRPKAHQVYGAYLAWLHCSKAFRSHYEAQAVGVTRFGLSQAAFKEARIPLPPLPEQQRIAAYLDASCAAIDAAVAAKRRQLETLDAVRESIIETAVTRGLNGKTKLQVIERDWIGLLPDHWAAVRIKQVISRLDYGISVSSASEGKYPVLKMGNIQSGEVVFSKMEFVDEVADELLLEYNDLLYNRTNSPDQVGKAALFLGTKDDAVTFASYLVRLRANHRIIPDFLNYAVNCGGFLAFARRLAIPSVQQSNLNSTRYGRLHIPLPPVTEQRAICEYLNAKIGEMKRVVAAIQTQITTLTAYRKSLIHECVTGQRRIAEADINRVQHG
ncbi:MAG: restriction endonuclease subunit S [Candidatus Contendobacter sp.]